MNTGAEKRGRSADYRRGTIMGLTVAEVFILLAFILLLLLALWRATEQKKYEELKIACDRQGWVRQYDTAELAWLRDHAGSDALAKVIAADMAMKDGARLIDNEMTLAWIDAMEQAPPEQQQFILTLAADDPSQVDQIIEQVTALKHGARLVEAEDLKKLIDALGSMPRTEREAFVDLLEANGYDNIIDWANKLAELVKNGRSPEEVANALELVKEIPPSDLEDIQGLIESIRAPIAASEQLRQEVAASIQTAVGGLVSRIGGEIDPVTGAITLPDTALFAQGSAQLSPQTRDFLDEFCPRWLDKLYAFGPRVGALRIEGHASTEWNVGVGPEEAFLNNMDLSQRRASAVLELCLRQVADGARRTWAQSRLVAVGYSSAHPIIEDGVENPVRSRRVVFRTEVDQSQIIRDIKRKLNETDGRAAPDAHSSEGIPPATPL
ncbi:MAG: OmpA family protein [Thiohalocapsa sp.]|jgi:outer membrane protein OmpA-like peptidoglycan-associated protein|uniref:OmpA/MotB family protein n=1 Tax=Thiohalocapsa sp. TaxID=2497641 RepID=UPI0025EA6BB5|nr:OmpA family protein [Thiohalocapsa sp.]MCG6941135.1 OmpA family protein [Thiohalocapsa sp.]